MKNIFVIVDVNLTIMTSTLKGITLKGSAELVADFFCKRSFFFKKENFDLLFTRFPALLHAGLACDEACVSSERVLANFLLVIKTESSCYIVRCGANPSRKHVGGQHYEAGESPVVTTRT